MKKLVILRRGSQIFFLGLFVYILWSTTYPLKGLFPADTFFKTNPNIMIFTALSERVLLPGLIFAVFMLVVTVVFGRFYCGWVCPLGTAVDLSGSLNRKRRALSEPANFIVRKVKILILGIILVAALGGVQFAWILDPMGITARFVSLNLIPTVTLFFEKTFIFLIRDLGMYGQVQDVYRGMRSSILGIKVSYFASSVWIFLFFLIPCVSAVFIPRIWCRSICPLGGMYSLFARWSLLKRSVTECSECGLCVERCRMGAIKPDREYLPGECVMCMDCIYDCPEKGIFFNWRFLHGSKPSRTEALPEKGMSRKDFLFFLIASFFAVGFAGSRKKGMSAAPVIRPPGALKEKDFLDRCIRCGNCMKVCPTNGLQPVLLQAGAAGVWTPALVPEIGYCEYNCALCGSVCPTGAIPKLSIDKKKKASLGTAKVNRDKCIAWAFNSQCLVCEEHCPVPEKAIKITTTEVDGVTVGRPYVNPDLCIGCGICQTKCPVRPVRAIKVDPASAERT
ncbi:MAG: 4Fe-4S binding protein [Candidatus Tantalella remota]|nr:4Fe-4S binding protein [Candidatus Tantalella remota]